MMQGSTGNRATQLHARGRCPRAAVVHVLILAASSMTTSGFYSTVVAQPANLAGAPASQWATTFIAQANGGQILVPVDRPVSRRSNLALIVDTRWANNYGYRPIEITVSAPKAVSADRFVTIRLYSARG